MKLIKKVKGYKATNKNMQCRGFQFEMNKVFTHDGELSMCNSGFHFCIHPSGVWCYYDEPGTRVFEVEAYDVLDERNGCGAEVKMVAQKIKFIREIKIGGYMNTGDMNIGNGNTGNMNTGNRNTGDMNTGNMNTGNMNTGNGNTGNGNTGSWNTGHRNTGHLNTGHRNTGDMNTGDMNTGNGNTGSWNTGSWNTGHRNTGHRNTGDGNATDYSSGFFCTKEQKVICFNKPTSLTRKQFVNKFPEYWELCNELLQDKPIDFKRYNRIPNITASKLKALHKKFKKGRNQ